MTHVWMALDPMDEQTGQPRVLIQSEPFSRLHMARGARVRGETWEVHEAEIDAELWDDVLAGVVGPEALDRIHRQLWIDNGGTPAWPTT